MKSEDFMGRMVAWARRLTPSWIGGFGPGSKLNRQRIR